MTDHSATTNVMLKGTIPMVLKLTYATSDPAAVRLELACQSWHVERAELARSLRGETLAEGDDDKCCAASWHCSPLSMTGRALLVLRSQRFGRLPMSAPSADLTEFLSTTYRMCPASHEQQLIAAALEAQLGMFATTTQEGQQ